MPNNSNVFGSMKSKWFTQDRIYITVYKCHFRTDNDCSWYDISRLNIIFFFIITFIFIVG